MQSQNPTPQDSILRITVNGQEMETPAGTLAELLILLDLSQARVATALNETFVPRTRRQVIALSDGDRVEIVSPRQGG